MTYLAEQYQFTANPFLCIILNKCNWEVTIQKQLSFKKARDWLEMEKCCWWKYKSGSEREGQTSSQEAEEWKEKKTTWERKHTRQALHLQAVSTINQVGYNKPVWSFLDGSIQSRTTQSPGFLVHNGNSLLLRLCMFVWRAWKWGCVLQSERDRKRCREQRERMSEKQWEEKQCCTFWVFLQERFGGWKETILTQSCLGLHSQPFFSSALRHSDLLVHLQKKDEQLPSAPAPHPPKCFHKASKRTKTMNSNRFSMCLSE